MRRVSILWFLVTSFAVGNANGSPHLRCQIGASASPPVELGKVLGRAEVLLRYRPRIRWSASGDACVTNAGIKVTSSWIATSEPQTIAQIAWLLGLHMHAYGPTRFGQSPEQTAGHFTGCAMGRLGLIGLDASDVVARLSALAGPFEDEALVHRAIRKGQAQCTR